MRISDLSSDLCSSDLGLHAVQAFLRTVPPDVAAVLRRPIMDVLEARSGVLLWLGGVVGLWTTTSFIETIRDILRRAYGTHYTRPRSEEHTSELQSLMRISYAVFCLQKQNPSQLPLPESVSLY